MRRLLVILLLVLIAGCGSGNRINFRGPFGGTQRLDTNQARYENHFFGMQDATDVIDRRLGQNSVAVNNAFQSGLVHLAQMEVYVEEEKDRKELRSISDRFEEQYKRFKDMGWQSVSRSTVKGLSIQFRNTFYPGRVAVLPDSENGNAPAVANNGGQSRVTPPPADNTNLPKEEPGLVSKEKPDQNGTDTTPYWIVFNGYTGAHDKLLSAVNASNVAGSQAAFLRVEEALGYMKQRFDAKGAGRLEIYINEYRRIRDASSNFSSLANEGAAANVARELDIVAGEIAAAFGPEK